VYLPPSLSWISIMVVISSALAGLQVSMTAGARAAYRMAREGHLPRAFGATNRYQAPWVSVVAISALAVIFVWYKPLEQIDFYYDAAVMTLALAYVAALASFVAAMFRRLSPSRAAAASLLPMLAICVLIYLMYSAGAEPADPADRFQAWYIGAWILASGVAVAVSGRPAFRLGRARAALEPHPPQAPRSIET
jgi:amino acid transporter